MTLDCATPLPEPLEDLALVDPDPKVLGDFLEAMEFRTLARRVSEARSGGAPASAPAPRPAAAPEAPKPIDTKAYACVRTLDELDAWIAKARAAGVFAFDVETDGFSAAADMCGLSLAVTPGEAAYVPVGHTAGDGLALTTTADLEQIPLAEAIARLKPMLEDSGVLKVAHNAKYEIGVLARHGIAVAPIEDTMLISYVLEAGLHGHSLEDLAKLWLEHQPIALKEVTGTGKATKRFAHVGLPEATAFAAEDADITIRLYRLLRPQLVKEGLLTVYETLERPLPKVLAQMERHGIRIDPAQLHQLSNDFSMRMADYDAQAQKLVGHPFNLGSPKQIGDVLFGEMGLPGGKKTATGVWSTDAGVLEELAAEGHPLPRVLLD